MEDAIVRSEFVPLILAVKTFWGLGYYLYAAEYHVCNRPVHAAFALLPFHLFAGGLFTLEALHSFLI